MDEKRILLMHISNVSGHHSASVAIENSLRNLDKSVQIKNIDGFNYTSPLAEKIINEIYMFVIGVIPQLWDHLYDNKDVLHRLRKVRSLIHRLKNKKINRLFNEFKPDVVVCTQAFPCGMVADYKRRHNLTIPLIGVLTDYAPHSYWLDELVDIYIVPALKIKQRLIQKGIDLRCLLTLGIPIDSKFAKQNNREETFCRLGLDVATATILIMGGGQGLGPIKEIVRLLDTLRYPVQLIVVCGTNIALFKWLNKNKVLFNKRISVIGYTEKINELMAISSFIVTKPGGLTSAEALSQSLPIIIVKPLPGQESQNTEFLLEAGVALKAKNLEELKTQAEELLSNSTKLDNLRKKAASLAQPDSARQIAQLILGMLKQS